MFSASCLLAGIISSNIVSAKTRVDYSHLFTKENVVCLSIVELAEATAISRSSISTVPTSSKTLCKYKLKLPNKETMTYGYGPMKTSLGEVNKEIRSYLKTQKIKVKRSYAVKIANYLLKKHKK